MKDRISLLISGNQKSNAGFQNLVVLEPAGIENLDSDYIGKYADAESYVECVHFPDYIKYELRVNSNAVSSCDSDRPGDLHISIAIEKGWRLANGKSPYDVLLEVWKMFRSDCMRYSEEFKKYYFVDENYGSGPFETLLRKEFPLEQFDGKYVVMSGSESAYMVLPESSVRQLLIDTQYDELSRYKSLVVSTKGSTANTLKLDIPRKVALKVIADRQEIGFVSQEQPFGRKLKFSPYFEDCDLSFTIEDLKSNKKIPGCVYEQIDWKNECVRVHLKFRPKCFRRRMEFSYDGNLAPARALAECEYYELCCDGGVCPQKKIERSDDGKLYVEFYGEELKYPWTLKRNNGGSGYNLRYEPNQDPAQMEAVNKIFVDTIVNVPSYPGGGRSGSGYHSDGTVTSHYLAVTEIDKNVTITVRFMTPPSDRIVLSASEGEKLLIPLPEGKMIYKIEFASKGFASENGEFSTENSNYSCKIPKMRKLTKWERLKEVSNEHKLFEMAMILIIGLVIGIGAAVAFISVKRWDAGRKTETSEVEAVATGGTDVASSEEVSEPVRPATSGESNSPAPEQYSEGTNVSRCTPKIQSRVDGYIEKLGTADVRFDDVDEIYRFASSADAEDARGIDGLKTMAECYHNAVPIVKRIIGGDIDRESAKTELERINKNASVGKTKDVLYNFRNAIQTLYFVRDTYKEKDLKYLELVYLDVLDENNPIRDVTTFSGLTEAKRKEIIKKEIINH